MTTTTFNINNMDRDTADGFVNCIHWTATQVDGEFTASTYSTQSFTKGDDATLVPYVDITKDMAIGWLKAALGDDTLAAIDASLSAQIEEQKAPKKAFGLPW